MSPPEIRRVGVVGLGAMGAGITQLAIEAGYETVGREVSEELGAQARDRIAHFLQRKVDKGKLSASDRESALASLSLTTELGDFDGCDLVIEAIVEDLDAKLGALRRARGDRPPGRDPRDQHLRVVGDGDRRRRSTPGRVVGMHFFNPAPLMPLVEIVRAELSSDEAVEAAFEVGERLGKRPIRCHDTRDSSSTACSSRSSTTASASSTRRASRRRTSTPAMTAGAGWPIGQCTLVDLVGIDVHVHASEALYEKLREPRIAPPARIVAMKNAGLLGRKSGRGFYTYD